MYEHNWRKTTEKVCRKNRGNKLVLGPAGWFQRALSLELAILIMRGSISLPSVALRDFERTE